MNRDCPNQVATHCVFFPAMRFENDVRVFRRKAICGLQKVLKPWLNLHTPESLAENNPKLQQLLVWLHVTGLVWSGSVCEWDIELWAFVVEFSKKTCTVYLVRSLNFGFSGWGCETLFYTFQITKVVYVKEIHGLIQLWHYCSSFGYLFLLLMMTLYSLKLVAEIWEHGCIAKNKFDGANY